MTIKKQTKVYTQDNKSFTYGGHVVVDRNTKGKKVRQHMYIDSVKNARFKQYITDKFGKDETFRIADIGSPVFAEWIERMTVIKEGFNNITPTE